jgi:single-strand DNA-binding protein
MSFYLNKIQIIGNVGKLPVIRPMADGKKVANFSVATTSYWTDKSNGDKKEETVWHEIEAWGTIAEIIENHVKAGTKVYIEGNMKENKWEDKETGQPRSKLRVSARDIIIFDRNNTSEDKENFSQESAEKSNSPEPNDEIPF